MMFSRMHSIVIFIALCMVSTIIVKADEKSFDIVMKPQGDASTSKAALGLVIIGGSQIPTFGYQDIAHGIQVALKDKASVYVAIPALAFDFAALQVETIAPKAVKQLHDAGLPMGAPIFYAGHGIGGAFLSYYVHDKKPVASGMILMGAGLDRKYRDESKIPFPVPTLTLAAELDGLYRVTRVAETYYHLFMKPGVDVVTNLKEFPVIVLRGQSHMQFAKAAPPSNVVKDDLLPEVEDEVARERISQSIGTFIAANLKGRHEDVSALEFAVVSTADVIEPIVNAMEIEGNIHLFDDTIQSSIFTSNFSAIIGAGVRSLDEMKNLKVTVEDNFSTGFAVPPSYPPHGLPSIVKSSDCKDGDCSVTLSTRSQSVFERDPIFMDIGYAPLTAYEIRTKLLSRQAILKAVGYDDADFEVVDAHTNICAEINDASIEFGLSMLSHEARGRFERIGLPLVTAEDAGPFNTGPAFMFFKPLQLNEIKDENGVAYRTEVVAPWLGTADDYTIKKVAGVHYCKILSPARVVEYAMIDGLRAKGGLSSKLLKQK
jgi:hypothetical protein